MDSVQDQSAEAHFSHEEVAIHVVFDELSPEEQKEFLNGLYDQRLFGVDEWIRRRVEEMSETVSQDNSGPQS